MGKQSDKATVKCDWPNCVEYYASRDTMLVHKKNKHVEKSENCTGCDKMFTPAELNEHCHKTCQVCSKNFVYQSKYREHVKTHPTQGTTTKYSLALELILNGDPTTIKQADNLAEKQMKKFKKEGGTKKAGVYLISVPWAKAPKLMIKYLEGQKYPGKDADPLARNNRKTGHNSHSERNDKLISFYEQCKSEGTRPIFFLAFDNLSPNAIKEIENAMILSYGAHNLCNIINGTPNQELDVNKTALFGAWLWREAFRKFKEFDFSDLNKRVDVSREQSDLSKAIVGSRKRKNEPEAVLTKQNALDELTAEFERISSMDDAVVLKQVHQVGNAFVVVDQDEPKPKVCK